MRSDTREEGRNGGGRNAYAMRGRRKRDVRKWTVSPWGRGKRKDHEAVRANPVRERVKYSELEVRQREKANPISIPRYLKEK